MDSFTPIMITIYLENGYCKLSNMPFDSILAKLYFQQEINNGSFDGDYYKQLPFLKMSDGIYHTSKPFYEINHIANETIIKSFNIDLYLELKGDMTNAPTITNNRSGRYKQHKVEFELIYTDKITYYVNGDYKYIEKLLQNLNFIGKKTSIGWGKISSIEMEELKEDYSLLKNEIPSRHLPDIPKYRKTNMYRVNMPLTPPYWRSCNDIALVSKDTL
ncbi:hypothetical protein N5T98_10855 [Aliarcobacter cryaerophilus]|uniref:hypothetical protein n=1 Tax=Aliarcobacter cryaerophilus TaxID=28198 RepID=UPI0021B59977|nr:hypothetical protein [Aliarcobacter cryaerophilus]MCT7487088.1 hypothetical protein [Aliarcobacter cryaerophilus]MCT7491598.1 hypothetical protein [Aliarcobacter cryaerophilus]